jgi:hypothetical protein
MFAKLNIKGFANASFAALNKTHLYELADITQDQLVILLGQADGSKFFYEFGKLMMEPQKDYIVMGALGFTSIAHKKWQSILEQVTIKDLYNFNLSVGGNPLAFKAFLFDKVNKIGDATANTIVNEWNFFVKDIEFIVTKMNIVDSFGTNNDNKLQIRFTGFRNQQLVEQLTNLGFDADDNASVTKKTNILLIPFDGFNSTKVTKAMANPETLIITKDNFINNSEQIIGVKINL